MFLDRAATVEKACRLVAEAGAGGARLAVFPEAFIPTYPLWVWFIPPADTKSLRELYAELVDQAVTIPDETTERLCDAARAAGVNVAIGVNERNADGSGGSLYNTVICIGEDGRIAGIHRKLVPTTAERLVWARGDGSTIDGWDLTVGRLAALICWENYMPLARYALWAGGTQILAAPTWDHGEPWISTLRHTAKEGRVYVLGTCSAVHRDDIPDRYAFKERYLTSVDGWINKGDSAIVDPDGKFLAEPVSEREEILYAEVDPRNFLGPRFQLDTGGHYARPDIFELTVRREPRPMLRTVGQADGAATAPDSDGPGTSRAKRTSKRRAPTKKRR